MPRPAVELTQLVDNERVRVTRFNFSPGAETGWHEHGMDYVITALTDCHMLLVDDAGERRVLVARGECYYRETGIKHNVINDGDREMSFVEVELK
ncbi:MAG: cupin domain-containing protein [Rhodobacteraceae bacterium]|nr:cupin domain-containing protein [Paracoccaceae bacterium]